MLALLLPMLLAIPAASVQARKLEDAKVRLEKLRNDPRRRRYRDGWESLVRQLEAAVRAAPNGPRASETALTAARVRMRLFEMSRSQADARAAMAALRQVDDRYPGSIGVKALYEAVELSWHTSGRGDRAATARRLIERYPHSPQARAVAARTAALAIAAGRRVSKAATRHERVSPAERDPAVRDPVPVEVADDDDGDDLDEDDAQSPPAVGPDSTADEKIADHGGDDESPPEPEAPADPPMRHAPLVRAVKNAVAALTEPDEGSVPPSRARQLRSTALRSPASLAAQLGLKVRRVVVDPGHGGRDTGAIGPHRLREKDLALAIARKLARRLKALGLQVVMTRDRDVFVPLSERTRIANEAHADLFVSIHCNAARRRKLSGVETWTLNVSADRYAARLAAFENAEADRSVSDLRMILADLATKANASDARDLAQSVQSSLVRTLRSRVGSIRDHGVKQALFYVLLGTHMPSILVETGFISNPSEEVRLRSARFQEGTADAIARGVREYVDSRRRLARVP